MPSNKLKLCPNKLFGILAFTSISAIALIITGVTLSAFPTEVFHEEIGDQKQIIDYTHCVPLNVRYQTCEDFFHDPNVDDSNCYCFITKNITGLHGKLTVHCQFEMSDRKFINFGNYTDMTFPDLISKTPGQCNPYTTEEPTANETCEAIPDEIFKDDFAVFQIFPTEAPKEMAYFSKSVRWGPAVGNSLNGLQNAITVLMNVSYTDNNTNTISSGNYAFYFNLPKNINIWRRILVLSTPIVNTNAMYRSNLIDIVALAVGLVLLFVSIAMFALRKRIQGVEEKTVNVVTEESHASNNRRSDALKDEVELLSPPLNNGTSKALHEEELSPPLYTGTSKAASEEEPLSPPVHNDTNEALDEDKSVSPT